MTALPEPLHEIVRLLLVSGGGPLGWWQIRRSKFSELPAVSELQQTYRLQTLQVELRKQGLSQIIALFRSAGLNPLLGKGWAIARLYPELALRPFGDLDFYVHPEQHAAALLAVRSPGAAAFPVDLHCQSAELDDRTFDELSSRSRPVSIGGQDVQVFGPEDHLRLLCLHMLRHGAWRPLWLCDIALALESLPATFDWGYFLSGDPRRTDWAVCAIGLAHQILGAQIDHTPVATRAKHLPGWLVPCVLRQWGAGQVPHGNRVPMTAELRHLAGLLRALRIRWPNGIEATVGVKGPFNNWPRLPFQLADSVRRTTMFLAAQAGLGSNVGS